MTMTEEDIERISSIGNKDFYFYKDGYLQLKNVQGHCIFLERDRCSIYEYRPIGCQIYPLILDIDTKEAFLHDFCPYNDEFDFPEGTSERLKKVIETEEDEKGKRVLKRLHKLSHTPGTDFI
jgi:Fe-S-cluster containining protein